MNSSLDHLPRSETARICAMFPSRVACEYLCIGKSAIETDVWGRLCRESLVARVDSVDPRKQAVPNRPQLPSQKQDTAASGRRMIMASNFRMSFIELTATFRNGACRFSRTDYRRCRYDANPLRLLGLRKCAFPLLDSPPTTETKPLAFSPFITPLFPDSFAADSPARDGRTLRVDQPAGAARRRRPVAVADLRRCLPTPPPSPRTSRPRSPEPTTASSQTTNSDRFGVTAEEATTGQDRAKAAP